MSVKGLYQMRTAIGPEESLVHTLGRVRFSSNHFGRQCGLAAVRVVIRTGWLSETRPFGGSLAAHALGHDVATRQAGKRFRCQWLRSHSAHGNRTQANSVDFAATRRPWLVTSRTHPPQLEGYCK
jgi:hypothetical protein